MSNLRSALNDKKQLFKDKKYSNFPLYKQLMEKNYNL
jgi:hypothetical protein